MTNLKLKDLPNLQIGVNTSDITIPIVVKRKIIMCECKHEIWIGEKLMDTRVINEYIGTIVYIAENPLLDFYTLNISIDETLYFFDSMKLFFKETKGTFRIPAKQRYDFSLDRILCHDLDFSYTNGVYIYKS